MIYVIGIIMVGLALGAPSDKEPPAPGEPDEGMGESIMKAGGKYDGGDMKLTEDQMNLIYGTGKATGYGGSYRYATMWDDAVVPYDFRSGDFYASTKADIRKAMEVIEEHTCIKFVKRTDQKDYIQIQDANDGCNSYLGNIKRGAQPLNLQNNGCLHFGTYLHELGHALGMVHEHQLPTRDNYVHYYKHNVKPNRVSQLKKYASYMANLHGSEYDLSSIMHYELTAFSKDRKSQTLGVDKSFMIEHIGRRYSHILSFGDVKVLNRMYSCHTKNRCDMDCPEPGFINKNCECVTPEVYKSRTCRNDPAQAAWCDKIARRGQCDRNDDYQHVHCAKACDFCPKFLPGTSGKGKPTELCVNQYGDDAKCDEWAAKGICSSYPNWIQRHCRKSCDKYEKTCSKKIGLCANRLSDDDCEGYANHWLWSYCTSNKDWGEKTRKQCPDSCKVCDKYD